jgi:hypothetical protein
LKIFVEAIFAFPEKIPQSFQYALTPKLKLKEGYKYMPDGPENDFFATQFATAIVKESGGDGRTAYWWGRMIRFLGSNEYVFRNFFGKDYTETEFRAKYESGEIKLSAFDISNINYVIDPNDPTLATVTMDVHIEGSIEGESKTGDFTLTHQLKQGWQAYESELS